MISVVRPIAKGRVRKMTVVVTDNCMHCAAHYGKAGWAPERGGEEGELWTLTDVRT
jgi:hypothetical protein